jgi:hypothetical protein
MDMDSLQDRMAALAEEVGEFAQPPGAAVTVWRARRRRRRVVAKVAGVGLFSVMVVALLLTPLGRGFPDADTPRVWTASSPATTRSPGSPGSHPTISWSPRRVAPGARVRVVGGGCEPIQQAEISIDRLGIRKSVPIKNGRYSTLLTVPRTAKAGTYDLTVRCFTIDPNDASDSDPVVVHDAVVVTSSNK